MGECENCRMGMVVIPVEKYNEVLRAATQLESILSYVAGCTYSPDKNVIFDIADVEQMKEAK